MGGRSIIISTEAGEMEGWAIFGETRGRMRIWECIMGSTRCLGVMISTLGLVGDGHSSMRVDAGSRGESVPLLASRRRDGV